MIKLDVKVHLRANPTDLTELILYDNVFDLRGVRNEYLWVSTNA